MNALVVAVSPLTRSGRFAMIDRTPSFALEPLKRSLDVRTADVVTAKLEQLITTGLLPGNTPLPAERELMAQFNASRTVIREAISALSNRGLLECRPRCRPIVRQPGYDTVLSAVEHVVHNLLADAEGVKNLYETRAFFERGLVREAAKSANKDDILKLKNALANNKQTIPDSKSFYETDVAFHGVLYGIPKNPVFSTIHMGFTSWLAPHWEVMPRSVERNEGNYKAHEAIYLAILERDADAAEQALAYHLNMAWQIVQGTFKAQTA